MIRAIKGTRDILPPETRLWQRIEQTARKVFESFGYEEIRPPILEQTELFARSVGVDTDIVSKEMYTFQDRDDTSVSLRPEATASVVRAYLEHGMPNTGSLKKFYYIGPMFRRERPQKGRYRQFYQIGAEVLRSGNPAVDAEVIQMVEIFLTRLGIEKPTLLLNSIGDKNCRPNYLKALRESLRRSKTQLCEDCQRRLDINPLRVLDCKKESCAPVIAKQPSILDYLCAECRQHFEQVKELLALLKISYTLAPRLVRGLDYYTRTTFEITSEYLGAQNALIGGGRYDGLAEILGGPPTQGIGFALGVDRLALVLAEKERASSEIKTLVYVAWLGESTRAEAWRIASRLREKGIACLIEFEDVKLKKALTHASRANATHALIVGDEEICKGRFALKDLRTGEQAELSEEAIHRRFSPSEFDKKPQG